MGKEDLLESLEAILVFVAPLLFVIPFYGFLTEVSVNYVVYAVYITCSIALTRYNGRSLAEIGLTRKGIMPSLGNSIILVVAAFVARFIVANLKLSPDINSLEAVMHNLL